MKRGKIMNMIGSDRDGVTKISLEGLEMHNHRKLESIFIESKSPSNCSMDFIFEGNDFYRASGFSIGYGGEGPHGLYKAIKMFYPDFNQDFWDTQISHLDPTKNWRWTMEKGFYLI
jgi:hypothetical protein